MDTLFTEMENERKSEVAPLAVRMRPRTLEEVVGQDEACLLYTSSSPIRSP